MVVLVNLKGVLDLCTEIFKKEEAMPDGPTSFFARLSNIKAEHPGRKQLSRR
ncbi:hypothetical protein F5Y12DRAFT_769459 [Xylaria sp. FL1777]|nr:hypothetical protein F5Y12DRAFT_769459 [Xylaria sp. FL1777]